MDSLLLWGNVLPLYAKKGSEDGNMSALVEQGLQWDYVHFAIGGQGGE